MQKIFHALALKNLQRKRLQKKSTIAGADQKSRIGTIEAKLKKSARLTASAQCKPTYDMLL